MHHSLSSIHWIIAPTISNWQAFHETWQEAAQEQHIAVQVDLSQAPDIHRSVKGHWIYDCLLMFINTFIDWFHIWHIIMFIRLLTIKGYEPSLKVVLCQTRVYRLLCIGFPGPNMLLQNGFVYRVVCNMGYAMAKKLNHNQLFVSLQNQNLSLQEKMKEFMKRKSTIALRLLKEMCYATAAGFQQEVFSSWATWLSKWFFAPNFQSGIVGESHDPPWRCLIPWRIHGAAIYIYIFYLTFTINIPQMLAYIPAPWIRHGDCR